MAPFPPPSLPQDEFSKQWANHPRRICLFVEPSPFSYVCGYKNRFQNFIKHLRERGDEVLVVTTHKGAPPHWYGARVLPSYSFSFFLYPTLPLSLAASPRIISEVAKFKPDLIHCSTPGIMCFGALFIAKLLSTPLVFSYHTHVPVYIKDYLWPSFHWLIHPMWWIVRFLHTLADLTLVVSTAMGKELHEKGCSALDAIRVWRKGVDSDIFNPSYKSAAMRHELTEGEVDKPLIVHVGRLGAEKNLPFLREVMKELPGVRLAFIGAGPFMGELQRMFAGTPTVFTGMLEGERLSQAYASGDVFVTPSESETLGFVVLEAMASGTPVVAARAGGIPDIVSQDGTTGFLFNPGDVTDCAAKLRRLIESPELRRKVALAARADVERLDWRASTNQVRTEAYSTAVRLFRKKREAVRSRFPWWPWWTKKEEWESA